MIRPFFRFATGREISVFNVHLGIGEAVLIPALASGSHTRASAPGRISKENSELGGRFYGKLGICVHVAGN